MISPTIRLAISDDLSEVLALYRQLNQDDPILDVSATEQVWSKLLVSGFTSVYVAELEGRLVSSCTLAIVPNLSRGARPYGVIENVVTDADHRRRGLARAVLEAAIDEANSANCYKVFLATGSKRESTLRFYEGVGFKRDAKTYFEIRRP